MRKSVVFMLSCLLLIPALANAWTLVVSNTNASATNYATVTWDSGPALGVKVAVNGSKNVLVTGEETATVTYTGTAPVAGAVTVGGVVDDTRPVVVPKPAAGVIEVKTTFDATSVATYALGVTQAQNGLVVLKVGNATTTTGYSNIANGTAYTVVATPNAGYKVTGITINAVPAVIAPVAPAVGESAVATSTAGAAATITATFGVSPIVTKSEFSLPTAGLDTYAFSASVMMQAIPASSFTYVWTVTNPSAVEVATGTNQSISYKPVAGATGVYTVSVSATAAGLAAPVVKTGTITISTGVTNVNAACTGCHTNSTPAVISAYNSGTHGSPAITCKGCHDSAINHGSLKSGISFTSTTTPATYEAGQSTAGFSSATGYAGADACQACHAETYAKWSQTLHNKPLKSVAAQGDTIFVNDSNNNGINDFKDGLSFITTTLPYNTAANASLPYAGGTYGNVFNNFTSAARAAASGTGDLAIGFSGGKYWMQVGNVKYEVVRTQGGNGKWKQRYQTKIGNAYYLLPLQYDEANRKYEAYNLANWYNNTNPHAQLLITGTGTLTDTNETTEVKDQVQLKLVTRNQASNGPSAGSWDNRCASCHQTGVSVEFAQGPGSNYTEVIASSKDLNIGCESCHGPGQAHVTAPAAANIKNPSTWNTNAATPGMNYYRANEVCGQCHSRVEGFAHFSSQVAGKVVKGIEAPSLDVMVSSEPLKAQSYTIGEQILDYIRLVIPNVFIANGTTNAAPSKTLNYDSETPSMIDGYVGSTGHHQQWHDMELGKHGATQQMGLNNGLTCFSCHDAHNPNSGNIRASIKVGVVTVPTASEDNTLCLACHAGQAGGAFSGLSALDIKNNPQGTAVKAAVFQHMSDKTTCVEAAGSTGNLTDKYLTSVQFNGSSANFGIMANHKVGQCISCHMPFMPKSGIASTVNGRNLGDQRSHTMKNAWPGLTGLTASKGLTSTTAPTSCSACHTVTN